MKVLKVSLVTLAALGLVDALSLKSAVSVGTPSVHGNKNFWWGVDNTVGKTNIVLQPDYGPWDDTSHHVGSYRGSDSVQITLPGFAQADWNDRVDIVAGLDGSSDTFSARLGGTNQVMCADSNGVVKWAPNGSGYNGGQCSFRYNAPASTYNAIQIADGTGRWLDHDSNTNNCVVRASRSYNWVVFTPLTPAPPPFVTAPWQSIRADGQAGVYQNGTLPTLADELAFFNAKTSALCQAPNGFSWQSVFQTIAAIANQGQAAAVAAARAEGYESGVAAGNQTGYAQGVAQGQTTGYQSGFVNGQREGNATGYTAGFNAGRLAGGADAYQQGLTEGRSQGRQQGFDEGKAAGLAQGRTDGFTSGRAEGFAAGQASCGNLPSGTTVSVRNYTDDQGNNRKETTVTAPEKTVIVTEWDTYVPPPHVHHKIVEERWPDGRKNITYTQTTDGWVWTNVTTVTVTPVTTETTVTNHTTRGLPEVDTRTHTITTPTGTVTDSVTVVLDPPTKTTTTDRDLPNGTHEHKVVVEHIPDGPTTTTTTNTYVDPNGVRHTDTNTDVTHPSTCPTALP